MPVNVCLVFTAFAPNLEAAVALSLVGSVLAQMDARPRASYVMAVVTPGECAAAASVTAVPCSLATAQAPCWPVHPSARRLRMAVSDRGRLKIVYDLLLIGRFRTVRTPEESSSETRCDRWSFDGQPDPELAKSSRHPGTVHA